MFELFWPSAFDSLFNNCRALHSISCAIDSVIQLGFTLHPITLLCIRKIKEAKSAENFPVRASTSGTIPFQIFCKIFFFHTLFFCFGRIRCLNFYQPCFTLIQEAFLWNPCNAGHQTRSSRVCHHHLSGCVKVRVYNHLQQRWPHLLELNNLDHDIRAVQHLALPA